MKKVALSIPMILMLVFPFAASAHEHATYKIGNAYYQFTIGSQNEPISVDDKTGLEMSVSKCFTSACAPTRGDDGDMDGPAGTPVTGLESTLKVELIAGDQKKMLPIVPKFGTDGSYNATFYPTLPTTFSYRLNGQVDGTSVDLTFTCLQESATAPANDTTEKKLSEGVTQTSHGGKFTCPRPKDALGFPVQAPTLASLDQSSQNSKNMAMTGVGLGAVSILLAGYAVVRRKS